MNKVHSLFILLVALISQTAFAGTLLSFGNSSFSVNTEITDIASYSQTSTSLTANGTDMGSNVTGNFSTLFTFANPTSSNFYLNLSVAGINPGSEFHLDLYNPAQDNYYRYTGSTINATDTAANFALTYEGLYNLSGDNGTAFTSFSAAGFTLDGSGSNIIIKLNYLTDGSKITPTVTWSNPANIIYGAALSGGQLNAVSSVSGTFSYTPASGTVLGVGNQTLSMVFTPTDTVNYNTVNRSVTLTVAKGIQNIRAFENIGNKLYGNATFVVKAPTASSGLAVALSVKSGPASISGNTTTLTGTGMVVLAANQAGNANFGPASEVTTSFVVNKGSQTIGAFTPVGAKVFGSAFSVIPPIASSGLPVVLSVKSGPANISANNTLTPTGLGSVVLAANQAGDANYNAASQVTTSFVVGKGNQTISAFAPIEPKLVGVLPFVIPAPGASSALPVVLTIKSGPATISTNRTLTITGPGNVMIAANQAGDANFNRAPEVTTTFLVTRPLSTLTVTVPAAAEGTVTLGFAGATTREVGANYTVRAIPASGMVSKGWRKGNATLSANATLKFTMEANMQLMPLFAPDFSKLAGTYNGLVGDGEIAGGSAQDMQAFPLKNGFVTFSLGSTGALSGSLSIEGQTSRFTGNFTTNKTAAITIARASKTPAQASLQLTPALPGEISGNITVSDSALSFRALRAAYTIGTASHALGSRTYTLVIPAPSGLALGHGFARVAIQKNGFATATGRLATGDAISASAGFVDSGDGNWVMPVYSTGNGIFTGEMVIPKIPSINSAELLGSFEWLRPANAASSLFPAGFLNRTNVAGTRYSIIAGNSLLSGNRTAAGFTLSIDPQREFLTPAIAQKGTWPSNNKPAFAQPISPGLQMTFSSANGSLQGLFNRTINGAQVPAPFQGTMFGKPVSTGNGQPMLRGAGFFISGNQSVPVEITLP